MGRPVSALRIQPPVTAVGSQDGEEVVCTGLADVPGSLALSLVLPPLPPAAPAVAQSLLVITRTATLPRAHVGAVAQIRLCMP